MTQTVMPPEDSPGKDHQSPANPDAIEVVPALSEDSSVERRFQDRRHFSLRSLSGAIFTLRRRKGRRETDKINSYIDWYEPGPLIASVLIILLSSLDAFLTLILLKHGAVELNVLMDWLIQMDIRTFAAVKLGVTSLALVVLVLHFNFYIYRVLPVRYLVYALMPLYALLIAHEINVLGQLPH